jgi:hypothetical protein
MDRHGLDGGVAMYSTPKPGADPGTSSISLWLTPEERADFENRMRAELREQDDKENDDLDDDVDNEEDQEHEGEREYDRYERYELFGESDEDRFFCDEARRELIEADNEARWQCAYGDLVQQDMGAPDCIGLDEPLPDHEAPKPAKEMTPFPMRPCPWPDPPHLPHVDLTAIFAPELTILLNAMASVTEKSSRRKFWHVSQLWRHYQYEVGRWSTSDVDHIDAQGRSHGRYPPQASGLYYWHFKPDIWQSPQGVHFRRMRDAMRKANPAERALKKARDNKRYEGVVKVQRQSPIVKTKRAEAERQRRRLKKELAAEHERDAREMESLAERAVQEAGCHGVDDE